MSQQTTDLETLKESLIQLLSGELKVGLGLLSVGAALKREGRNRQWVIDGLAQWTETHEDAIPLLAAALGEKGLSRVQEWLDKRRSEPST